MQPKPRTAIPLHPLLGTRPSPLSLAACYDRPADLDLAKFRCCWTLRIHVCMRNWGGGLEAILDESAEAQPPRLGLYRMTGRQKTIQLYIVLIQTSAEHPKPGNIPNPSFSRGGLSGEVAPMDGLFERIGVDCTTLKKGASSSTSVCCSRRRPQRLE